MADNTLYRVLGLQRNASSSDIKKAYKRLAMEYHPDRNANANANDKFKELGFAYNVLSDPQKRARYDKFGLDAVRDGGESDLGDDMQNSFFNLFGGGGIGGGLFGMPDMMFGGMGGMGPGMRMRRNKNEDSVKRLEVTLADLYNGHTIKVPINRQVVCSKCSGLGAKVLQKCMPCHGRGVNVAFRQLGRGMTRQIHQQCVPCQGTGEIMLEKDRCRGCKGKKTMQMSSTLEVHIDQGMKNKQKMRFTGMGDEAPNMDAGDLYIVLDQTNHNIFKRSGDDLVVKLDVSITEALCGYQTVIEHLDGRNLIVRTSPGEVLQPGCLKTIEDEGMPLHRSPFQKGQMIVHFDVHFPENHFADETTFKMLEALLPPRIPRTVPPAKYLDEVEMFDLKDSDDNCGRGRGEAYDEDDEEMGGEHGNGIRCAQQ